MAFRFVDGERAAKLDALAQNPPAPPKGVRVRKARRYGSWDVIDENKRILGTWSTYPAALRDCERYQKAERAHAERQEAR